MDQERLGRIVRVEAFFKRTKKPQRGTGFRVGPGLILTSQHVVERGHERGKIEAAKEIFVDPQRRKPVTPLWKGENELDPEDPKALDVALLLEEAQPEDAPQEEAFHKWVRWPLGESGHWESVGFAAASPNLDEEELKGDCSVSPEEATYFKLSVNRRPPVDPKTGRSLPWAGMSGAPVFIREGPYKGYLYGVIRKQPKSYDDQLYAVGTPALLRNAELCRRLGIKEPAPPHLSLVEKLRGLLEEDSRLTQRLASFDPSWKESLWSRDCDGVTDALCARRDLVPLLEHLRTLHNELRQTSERLERLRELAVLIVAIVVGPQLPGGEELTAESTRRIRMGTASPNFAEALLASAFGKPPSYEKGEGHPRGKWRMPTSKMEAGIRPEREVREQLDEIEAALLEEDLNNPKLLSRAIAEIYSHRPFGERRKYLEKALEQRLSRLARRCGRPPYIVVSGQLQKRMGAHLDTFLSRIEGLLPSLRVLVLDPSAEAAERALDQEDAFDPLWEILDLLPEE